ncbi:MAG: hypothetical protein V4539_17255 [Bacteroidota bacterium]
MQLKIERWIASQRFNASTQKLFDESIKSYKNGAYKAGLLFSYLAFMNILKERISTSAAPPGIVAGQWTSIQHGILNAETWDKKVFETTQQKTPAPIYPITDTLRHEILYWKDRRNDCAHYKHENIEYHHVESLWSFLETNLNKLMVNGGMDSLLIKFENHFDAAMTAPGTVYTNLIDDIASAVDPAQLGNFYSRLEQALDDTADPHQNEVFDKILSAYNDHVADSLVSYIKSDQAKMLTFLREYPSHLQKLDLDATQVRTLWHSNLFTSSRNDYAIYTGLLANNLIPATEIDEAHERILSHSRHIPTTAQSVILERNNFYPILHQILFPVGGIFGYRQVNALAGLFIHYLSKFPITADIISSISATFSFPYEPRVLEDQLTQFFAANAAKAAECTTVLNGPPVVQSIIMRTVLGLPQI